MLHPSETVAVHDAQNRLAMRFPKSLSRSWKSLFVAAYTDHPGATGDCLPVAVEREDGARLRAITHETAKGRPPRASGRRLGLSYEPHAGSDELRHRWASSR